MGCDPPRVIASSVGIGLTEAPSPSAAVGDRHLWRGAVL